MSFARFINYAFGLAPFTATVVPGNDQTSLVITPIGIGTDEYDISIDSGATFTSLNNATASKTITGLTAGTTYHVVVKRHAPGAKSKLSPTYDVATYAACAVLTYVVGTKTATTIPLNTIATIGGGTYDVSTNGGTSFAITGQTGTSYTITGLTTATAYSIVLRHHCLAGGYTDTAPNPQTTP